MVVYMLFDASFGVNGYEGRSLKGIFSSEENIATYLGLNSIDELDWSHYQTERYEVDSLLNEPKKPNPSALLAEQVEYLTKVADEVNQMEDTDKILDKLESISTEFARRFGTRSEDVGNL